MIKDKGIRGKSILKIFNTAYIFIKIIPLGCRVKKIDSILSINW